MPRLVRALLAVVLVCVLPLALGLEGVLLVELPGGLPLGTLLAAVAFVAGAAVPVVAGRAGTGHRRVASVVLVAALLWLPLGAALAGNPSLSFVDDPVQSAFFWRFTGALGVAILAMWGWTAVAARWRRTVAA